MKRFLAYIMKSDKASRKGKRPLELKNRIRRVAILYRPGGY